MKELYTMVGMQYRHSEQVVAGLKNGTRLELRRDPNNPHDFNAVEVRYQRTVVAFIKGTEVPALAREMDKRGLASAACTFVVGADRWPQVEVDLLA